MKIARYLHEEFLKYVKGHKRNIPVPVWKNPTPNELAELKKELRDDTIRVIVDVEKKNVYVWDAYLAIHYTVIKQIPELSSDLVELISGITSRNKIDNKWNLTTIEWLPKEVKIYFEGK